MKDFKSAPWDVYVAALILVAFYVMICVAFPVGMFVFTVTAATILSFFRICHYLINGN